MMLICPKCKCKLNKIDNSYKCDNNHSFDIAKRGYVNLVLGNSKATGDDKHMVNSRTQFLNHGYYEKLRTCIGNVLSSCEMNTLVDAGCGEGYYTNYFKQLLPSCEMYGFDLSKYAVDEACKAKSGVNYCVCSIFHLPLDNLSCDGVISIFAPVDMDENTRILKENGYFLQVGPGPKHLWGLKQELYSDIYENQVKVGYEGYKLVKEEYVEDVITIDHQEDIWALFQMTPYYWRTPKENVQRLKNLNKLITTVQFHVALYQKEENSVSK